MNEKTLKHECACGKRNTEIDESELNRILEEESGCGCGCHPAKDIAEFADENSFEAADDSGYSIESIRNQYENAKVNYVDESNADNLEAGSDAYFGENGRYNEKGFTADKLYSMIPDPQLLEEDMISGTES